MSNDALKPELNDNKTSDANNSAPSPLNESADLILENTIKPVDNGKPNGAPNLLSTASPAESISAPQNDGSSDQSQEEEEEEEPTLKYNRLGNVTSEIIDKDNASALAVSNRFIALGTHGGNVFILDFQGDVVKRFKSHRASVMDLSIDNGSEFIGSASVDGRISIVSLSSSETYSFDMRRPMRCIALDPDFAKRSTRQFVCGGMAGTVVLHEKGWLGQKETILHTGESPIWSTEWRANLVAWATDEGVRIYDTYSNTRVTYISRPANSPRADIFKPTLFFRDDKTLIIAWADQIKLLNIKERPRSQGSILFGEVSAILQTDCMISGIVPYRNEALLILAYPTEDTFINEATEDREEQRRKISPRPELRIISRDGEELSSDALSLKGYERFQCSDYSLAGVSGDEIFYVICPKDLVTARPRDETDHITWLVERQNYREALEEVERLGIKVEGLSTSEIGIKYLGSLVEQGNYGLAAALCPKTLGTDSKAWEHWIFLFIEKGQIGTIIPYIPTQKPRLDHVVYEMVMAHFLRHDPSALLNTIRTWPQDIYDIGTIILAIEGFTSRENTPSILLECLAELYINNRQPAKALPYYLQLRRSDVFDLIKDYNLFTDVQDQIALLIEFDRDLERQKAKNSPLTDSVTQLETSQVPKRYRQGQAIALLVDHTHGIPIRRVVAQLQSHRKFLYMYLDALFDRDPHLGGEFSDLQVGLYAEFDPSKLMDFLRASNYYNFEKAYNICSEKDLVPEMVFLLGRMGNNKQALELIIEKLGDVQRAIEFAKEQSDDDLWEDLLKHAESRPLFMRGLLENVGAEIDPLRLIRRIKNGLEIPGLRQALLKILYDFNIQISLLDGCKTILYSDCRHLSLDLYDANTNAFLGNPSTVCNHCGLPVFSGAENLDAATAKAVAIIFLCRHVYHAGCIIPDDLPPRPRRNIPVFASDTSTLEDSRNIEAKVRFSADLRSRAVVHCPACHLTVPKTHTGHAHLST